MTSQQETKKSFYSDKDLSDRYGVGRATIWRWLKRGELPSPVKLSDRCTRWRAADIALFESEGGQ